MYDSINTNVEISLWINEIRRNKSKNERKPYRAFIARLISHWENHHQWNCMRGAIAKPLPPWSITAKNTDWATRSSVRSFARTAHSFACSRLWSGLWSKIEKNTDKIAIQSFTVLRAREGAKWANEWMSERCARMSERTSEWPSTTVCILGCYRP